MPLGFKGNILTKSSATGANAFVGYDGSNDQTLTRNAAVQGFLGFAAFNDEYGVSLHITDAGGSSPDVVRYDVLRNNSGTLSIANQEQSFITTGTSNYSTFQHKIVPTNSGNIFVDTDNAAINDAAIFSISGSTVTQHTTFNSSCSIGAGGRMYRQPGSDVYVNTVFRGAELVTLTDNGNSSSDSTGTTTFVANGQMYYNQARVIQGFKDANTMLTFRSIASGDNHAIQPFELDLTSTGQQDVVSNLVGSQVTLDLNTPSNVIDFGQSGSSHFETTDFNNMCLFVERKGSGTGQIRVHHYTAGDSTTSTSNTLTYSGGGDSDISPTGCFVGANNDVFLFAHLQNSSNMIILKFVKSTNTLSEITRINESFNVEKCRMSRWGDGAALLTYNDVKMRLIKP